MPAHVSLASRFGLVIGGLVCSLVISAPALGQERGGDLQRLLDEVIETKDFTEPMPLKQALQLFYEKFAAKGQDFPILVDVNSFRSSDDGRPNGPYDDEVRLPHVPKVLTTGDALQIIVSQIKSNNGAMLIRNGKVEIVNQADATQSALLRTKIFTRFENTPFADVMQRLSYLSGATIVVDPRLKDARQTPITLNLRGAASLESVLRMAADLANARIVLVLDGGIYVTTPANADAMEKSIRQRKEELEKEKVREAQ
jgi:hypothetical protein